MAKANVNLDVRLKKKMKQEMMFHKKQNIII